jgi:hypothetical protein
LVRKDDVVVEVEVLIVTSAVCGLIAAPDDEYDDDIDVDACLFEFKLAFCKCCVRDFGLFSGWMCKSWMTPPITSGPSSEYSL